MTARIEDTLARPLRSLRISVTDRCNLRCQYCMPEADYRWLPRKDILSFEEIGRLVAVFGRLGVDKVRLTGGEPLLRRDLHVLIAQLAALPSVRDLAITTNGVLLSDRAQGLADAGLHRITVSLDTLDPELFTRITRFDAHAAVLTAIDRAAALWPMRLKIDTVLERGVNDHELVPLLRFGRDAGAEVRFIEYMDVGGATRWRPERVVSRREILARVGAELGVPKPIDLGDWAPADRFQLPDGTTFGVISSTTEPFCRTCDRSRLTADGSLLTCLYARDGIDLRAPLRAGATDEELADLVGGRWQRRDDRGAEQRLEAERRGSLVPVEELREKPHLEMHTRGG